MIPDEEQVKEMEFIDAATEYVHAEKRRVVALSKRGKRTCAEFDAIDAVYRAEKRLSLPKSSYSLKQLNL